MTAKVWVSGLVAGVVLFFWGFVSHSLLGLGDAGIDNTPNEEAVADVLRQNIPQSGIYRIPGVEMSKQLTPREEAAWNAAYARGPVAMMIVQTNPGPLSMGPLLITQLVIDLISCTLAAALFFAVIGSLPTFSHRVLFVGCFGLIASLTLLFPYWNWYGFPTHFVFASTLDRWIGWTLAGIVMALIARRSNS